MNKIICIMIAVFGLAAAGCDKQPLQQDVATQSPQPGSAPAQGATSIVKKIGTDQVPSEPDVGIVADGKITSTGKAGYLIYGPYSSLSSGNYAVTIDGTVESIPENGKVVVDVVHDQGKSTLFGTEIKAATKPGEALATFALAVPENVSDIELRVQVPQDSKVQISGYRIEKQN